MTLRCTQKHPNYPQMRFDIASSFPTLDLGTWVRKGGRRTRMRNEKVAGAICFAEFSKMFGAGSKKMCVLNLFVLKCLRLKSLVLLAFL